MYEQLAHLGAATVFDGSGSDAWLSGFIPFGPPEAVSGRLRAVACAPPRDTLGLVEALEVAEPGDILFMTSLRGTDRSSERPSQRHCFLGDNVALRARVRGIRALVVDGFVRDSPGLAEVGLPVWARGVHLAGSTKDGPFTIDEPVVVDGVELTTGSAFVIDRDGAVCVPADRVEQTLTKATAKAEREAQMRDQLRTGASLQSFLNAAAR